jgi:hypothetical protein
LAIHSFQNRRPQFHPHYSSKNFAIPNCNERFIILRQLDPQPFTKRNLPQYPWNWLIRMEYGDLRITWRAMNRPAANAKGDECMFCIFLPSPASIASCFHSVKWSSIQSIKSFLPSVGPFLSCSWNLLKCLGSAPRTIHVPWRPAN